MPEVKMSNDDREPIWSVSNTWAWVYFTVFGLQVVMMSGYIAYQEVRYFTDDSALDTYLAIVSRVSPGIITVVAHTLTLVLALEGSAMLVERYLKRRYREGKEEGKEEGLQTAHAEWVAWLNRKAEAESRNESFDEPSPAERESINQP